MRSFIKNTLIFLIPVLVLYYVKPLYLMYDNKYQNKVAGAEIYWVQQKSKKKTSRKKLLLGDSVARQLFNSKKDTLDVNILTSNQAISMVGQYALLQNYMKSGNELDKLILLFHPTSLQNNLDQDITFHYFLKPFYKEEYISYFDKNVIDQIEQIPFYYLCREPSVLTTNWAPNIKEASFLNYSISPISESYLKKIIDLSEQESFDIIFLPTPVREDDKTLLATADFSNIKDEKVRRLLNEYFNKIQFYSKEKFEDEVHLANPASFKSYYVKQMGMH